MENVTSKESGFHSGSMKICWRVLNKSAVRFALHFSKIGLAALCRMDWNGASVETGR